MCQYWAARHLFYLHGFRTTIAPLNTRQCDADPPIRFVDPKFRTVFLLHRSDYKLNTTVLYMLWSHHVWRRSFETWRWNICLLMQSAASGSEVLPFVQSPAAFAPHVTNTANVSMLLTTALLPHLHHTNLCFCLCVTVIHRVRGLVCLVLCLYPEVWIRVYGRHDKVHVSGFWTGIVATLWMQKHGKKVWRRVWKTVSSAEKVDTRDE